MANCNINIFRDDWVENPTELSDKMRKRLQDLVDSGHEDMSLMFVSIDVDMSFYHTTKL